MSTPTTWGLPGTQACLPISPNSFFKMPYPVQICYEYASHMGPAGLSFGGFQGMYDNGHGCPETDYSNLGYKDDPTPASIAKAKREARDTESIDIWDPSAVQQQVRQLDYDDITDHPH